MKRSRYSLYASGQLIVCILFLATGAMAQDVSTLTFRNIDVWPAETPSNSFIQVVEDAYGYLWFTSSLGVYRYDGDEVRAYYTQRDSVSLAENYTELLYEDSDGDIWVGTVRGALHRYVKETDKFKTVIPFEAALGHLAMMSEDQEGGLWISAATGLYSFNKSTNAIKQFTPATPPENPGGYGFRVVAASAHDPGSIWVAGLDGAYKFNITTSEFEPLPDNLAEGQSYMLMDLHEAGRDQLWGGSWFGGLLEYNIGTKVWRRHLPGDVPPRDDKTVVKAILPYNNGFWVSLRGSFGYFNIDRGSFELIDIEGEGEGSLRRSFNYHGICITRSNRLVVANARGFSISTPLADTGTEMPFAPQLQFIAIDGKLYEPDTVASQKRQLHLGEDQRDVRIGFSTPGYYGDQPVEYSYRLEGYDKDWLSSIGGNEIRYTNIPGGRYVFHYRARVENGDWLLGQSVFIIKHIPLIERPWFIALIACLLLVLAWIFYSLRVQRIRSETKIREEFNRKLTEVEMSALRAQMNPHFMFNSLNSIKYFILDEDTEEANKYLTKFSRLMRLVLKNSQSKLVNLSDELEALGLYIQLESLRFRDSFSYEINVDDEIDQDETFVPPLILQPFVENAIWHGLMQKNGPGNLDVTIRREADRVMIQITDDGIGREKAREIESKSATRKSFGIKLTADRIALVNRSLGIDASIEIHDLHNPRGDATGTQVRIQLPLIDGSNIGRFDVDSKEES